jgi:NAD(P) transhydrogenase subunit alpha
MESFLVALTVFVLAIFVGFEVITKVPPTLHTPLMSGSNAWSYFICWRCSYDKKCYF